MRRGGGGELFFVDAGWARCADLHECRHAQDCGCDALRTTDFEANCRGESGDGEDEGAGTAGKRGNVALKRGDGPDSTMILSTRSAGSAVHSSFSCLFSGNLR